MITSEPNFRQITESKNFIIGYVFEDAYLINKNLSSEIYLGVFFGDPTCAIIADNEKWCLVGGRELVILKEGKISEIKNDFGWIIEVRQIAAENVELLVEPKSSDLYFVYNFDVKTHETIKLRELSDEDITKNGSW